MSDPNLPAGPEPQPEPSAPLPPPTGMPIEAAPVATPTAPVSSPKAARSATIALVVGIVAAVMAIIPGVSFVAFVPAIVAGVFGLIAVLGKVAGRGRGLAGLILGPVALLVAIIVSISTIVGASHLPTAHTAVTSSPPAAASPAPSAAATTSAPSPTATVAPPPADTTYSGHGDSVVPIVLPDGPDRAGVATLAHNGSRNFAVWSLDANLTQMELLVNEIGPYTGTVLFDIRSSQHTTALEITADGDWTVTLHPLSTIRSFNGSTASGHGDDVLLYAGGAGIGSLTHDGSRNFAIWSYGNQSDLVVNEIGPYSGSVRWPAGPSVIAVSADGTWNITVQ